MTPWSFTDRKESYRGPAPPNAIGIVHTHPASSSFGWSDLDKKWNEEGGMYTSADSDHKVERISWHYLLDRRGILVENVFGKISQAAEPNWYQSFWDSDTDCSGALHEWNP